MVIRVLSEAHNYYEPLCVMQFIYFIFLFILCLKRVAHLAAKPFYHVALYTSNTIYNTTEKQVKSKLYMHINISTNWVQARLKTYLLLIF